MKIRTLTIKYAGNVFVNSLKSLQNFAVLIPKLPRIVPKGGPESALAHADKHQLRDVVRY